MTDAPPVPSRRGLAFGLLTGAIVSEVSGSLALAAAQQNPAWFALTALGYAGSFVLLGAVLRAGMPLGVAYGIWGAVGVVLTALMGTVLFADPITPPMLAGIAFVVAGVVLVNVGSERAKAAATRTATASTAPEAAR